MLALRLTRRARPTVQLRRLLVTAASAGTGFLLLCALGHALSHPHAPAASALRLAWCAAPLAATVHFAVAVARTDPGTRPRPGLSAIGLGPVRLMAVAATTTALSTALGSALALLSFLHLRGDLTGLPLDGATARFLAAGRSLPLPAALTLLALVPAAASLSVALVLRPQERRRPAPARGARTADDGRSGAHGPSRTRPHRTPAARAAEARTADARTADARTADADDGPDGVGPPAPPSPPFLRPDRRQTPVALPWGIATLAAGLAVEAYADRAAPAGVALPGGLAGGPAGVFLGWALTALGLALAGPGLTHLTGRLVQAARPGALRLLAGRVLMAEASRIGRPLGVVCAVASGAYATAALRTADGPSFGPLSALGALLVAGCALATLLTAAVEARQARAETVAALLRLGARPSVLRTAAALRAGALVAVFTPLTLVVAELAAQPLAR